MEKLERNFNEFEAANYKQWKEAADATLKGADFGKLFTKTYEDIELKPIYNPEDTDNLDHIKNQFPGIFPFLRGNDPDGYTHKPWQIRQDMSLPAPELFNEATLYDLKRGQTAVNTRVNALSYLVDTKDAKLAHGHLRGLTLSNIDDYDAAFANINFSETPVYMETGNRAPAIAAMFKTWCERKSIDTSNIIGGILFDPIMKLVSHGSLELDEMAFKSQMRQYVIWAEKALPHFKTIGIDSSVWHNAGANAAQELGYALASAAEYMRAFKDDDPNMIASKIQFTFAIGSNFFMEIAKLRAARMLWAKIAKEFGVDEENARMFIFARTSRRNKSRLDAYVNMLRTTTETLAAVIGGADAINTDSFDDVFGLPDKFSRRIARNNQLIIREEAHFAATVDPGGGSWYLEHLSAELAEKAWEIFRNTERAGGMFKALIGGEPQAAVSHVFDKRMNNYRTRKEVMVGVNKYPNTDEKPVYPLAFDEDSFLHIRKNMIESHIKNRDSAATGTSLSKIPASIEKNEMMEACIEAAKNGSLTGEISDALRSGRTECNIIYVKRYAELFEELRENSVRFAASNDQPMSALLANFGALRDYKVRADFSADFMKVGGFEIESSQGFESIDVAVNTFAESKHQVVVICSSDDKYPDIVPEFARKVKNARPDSTIVLAGYPKANIDEFTSSGVDEFIHIRADIYDILSRLQNNIGM
ncbi:MAG: methylmalonyl-CoA mutase family protein [Candidatus Kapaibacterium sp.]